MASYVTTVATLAYIHRLFAEAKLQPATAVAEENEEQSGTEADGERQFLGVAQQRSRWEKSKQVGLQWRIADQGPILPRWGRRHVPTMSPLYVPILVRLGPGSCIVHDRASDHRAYNPWSLVVARLDVQSRAKVSGTTRFFRTAST